MKKFVALLLVVMMMVTGMTAASAMTAGTYTASAKGFGGDVTVTVEVSDSAIVSVTAEGAAETAGIGVGDSANDLPMMQNNHPIADGLHFA